MEAERIKTHLFATRLLLSITDDYKPLFFFHYVHFFVLTRGGFADRALSQRNICVIKLVHGELPAAAAAAAATAATAACC